MPDEIVIDDDMAAVHVANLEKLYSVATAELDRGAQLRALPNIEKMRRALAATVEAYKSTLSRVASTNNDPVWELTGHHVMARWSREKMEEHSPGSTGTAPI